MNAYRSILILLLLVAQHSLASHLSQAKVDELMEACEAARATKLAPERRVAIENCMHKGEGDQEQCTKLYGHYGDRTTGGIRKLGKYYDLPECEKSYRARKHYKMNPGR